VTVNVPQSSNTGTLVLELGVPKEDAGEFLAPPFEAVGQL
jgi:hypothetical protein